MNTIGHSRHLHHSNIEVLTIDGEQVNGGWNETLDGTVISFYHSHTDYDFQGNVLRKYPESDEHLRILCEWIKTQNIVHSRSGWSTKTQSWNEWTIV